MNNYNKEETSSEFAQRTHERENSELTEDQRPDWPGSQEQANEEPLVVHVARQDTGSAVSELTWR